MVTGPEGRVVPDFMLDELVQALRDDRLERDWQELEEAQRRP